MHGGAERLCTHTVQQEVGEAGRWPAVNVHWRNTIRPCAVMQFCKKKDKSWICHVAERRKHFTEFHSPTLLVRGVHHLSVTVSFSPLSLLVLPAMCKSPTHEINTKMSNIMLNLSFSFPHNNIRFRTWIYRIFIFKLTIPVIKSLITRILYSNNISSNNINIFK